MVGPRYLIIAPLVYTYRCPGSCLRGTKMGLISGVGGIGRFTELRETFCNLLWNISRLAVLLPVYYDIQSFLLHRIIPPFEHILPCDLGCGSRPDCFELDSHTHHQTNQQKQGAAIGRTVVYLGIYQLDVYFFI